MSVVIPVAAATVAATLVGLDDDGSTTDFDATASVFNFLSAVVDVVDDDDAVAAATSSSLRRFSAAIC